MLSLSRFLSVFALTLVVMSVAVVNAQTRRIPAPSAEFKNLSGPVEEIASMRIPDPVQNGTRSKAAMIALDASDGFQEFDIPVDSAENFRLMLITPNGRSMTIRAAVGGSDLVDLRTDGFAYRVTRSLTTYGLEGDQFPAEVFSIPTTRTGNLRVRIDFSKSNRDDAAGFLVASSESNLRAYSYIDTHRLSVGREIGFGAMIFDAKRNRDEGLPESLSGATNDSSILIRTPSGKQIVIAMTPESGALSRGGFVPTEAGRHTAQIVTRGRIADGTEILRTTELAFDVSSLRADISADAVVAQADELRFRIGLPVSGLSVGAKVIVNGEVWGRGDDGSEFPVAWVGGMTKVASGRGPAMLPLTFDSRWLAQTPGVRSFALRNVRIQDPDTAGIVGETDEVSLRGIFATDLAKSFVGVIDDEMRLGVRPARTSSDAVGGKLMLVHGYCSGDAWGPAASAGQFTNYVKFLDLNKNRTHDQFANLIKNFGASLPSFGIVAHSQGGAASLHLYTYYWSGLDSATGTRLIQSVGTPYQGTALAGNLAILGQIFGAGCGSNSNLTYSGASAWLAGIPTWARAKVYYHTTAFTDVWWRYDYCNIATDPFLSDPDDGVVERAYAQLSGAVNLGHKTGWCHTTGMRDPAQTGDSSRNANMNSNAAR